MATDFFLVALLSPGGLFVLVVMLLLGVGLWLALLGKRRAHVGLWPLLAGLFAAIAVLVALSVASAWATFVGRTGSGRLPDEMFWQIVPGWALYTFAVFIFFVLFGLLFIAGPIAALLARWGRYDWRHVSAILLGVWLLLTALTELPMGPDASARVFPAGTDRQFPDHLGHRRHLLCRYRASASPQAATAGG